MPTLIHQTIPQRHIRALLEEGHYFTPCGDFRDKVEFRYGYCLFNYHFASASGLERCVRKTRDIPEVNQWIGSTGVSCWVREIVDESQMWTIHGRREPAIRISIDAGPFVQSVKSQTHEIAFGDVTYGGCASGIRPQFLGTWNLGDVEDAIHHLFFHKRLKYKWEHEFRLVLFSNRGRHIKMIPDMIDSVEVSPLEKLDEALRSDLRNVFGDRFTESDTDRRALQARRSDKLDETLTSEKLCRLVRKLHRLETRSAIVGKGWNDPKISRSQMKSTLKIARQIFETRRELQAEREAIDLERTRHKR